MRRIHAGFTLIEPRIVAAIIEIPAAAALPACQKKNVAPRSNWGLVINPDVC